ncbi:MAG: TonB-dependent receptor plug domain-containing protein, partial [Chitinivibrionales bacterium]|nr:TonB-dependent receptor plug domain-containing protein [Chitinivibrionales bacterium]MBD3357745.1 TonB-dependent receptor plug domain-containing protein [Chitinivibrionales bacterium]
MPKDLHQFLRLLLPIFICIVVSVDARDSRMGTIGGVVMSAEDGRPILAAMVTVEERSLFSRRTHALFTDTRGIYAATIPVGSYTVFIHATGYRGFNTKIDVTPDTTIHLDARLKKTGGVVFSRSDTCSKPAVVIGSIVDAHTGVGIEAANVIITEEDMSVRSGKDGVFGFMPTTEGPWTVNVRHKSYRDTTGITLRPVDGRPASLKIALILTKKAINTLGSIAGDVYHRGAPVSGARVTLAGTAHGAVSSDGGRFTVSGVPGGIFDVVIGKHGYATRVIDRVSVEPGDTTFLKTDLDSTAAVPRASATGAVAGLILDSTDTPLSEVAVFTDDGAVGTKTDDAGRFALRGLTEGLHTIKAVAEGYDTAVSEEIMVLPHEETFITLRPSKTGRSTVSAQDATLGDSAVGATLSGLVVDRGRGSGIAGASVTIPKLDLSVVTDMNGRFAFTGVPPALYRVVAAHPSFDTASLDSVPLVQGKRTQRDFALKAASSVEMTRMTVHAEALKNTSASLLDLRREAMTISTAIGADEMSKAGAGDAAEAMKYVPGVTILEGKYVIIRGFGPRYVNALIDGLRLPPLDPDKNAVPLDLFPTGLIDNITTTKSGAPDMWANFSGGRVDIATAAPPESFTFTIGASTGANTASTIERPFVGLSRRH